MRPTTTFFSIPTISMPLVGQDRQRVVQTRLIHPNLVVADPFEDQDDFLRGRKHEVYLACRTKDTVSEFPPLP